MLDSAERFGKATEIKGRTLDVLWRRYVFATDLKKRASAPSYLSAAIRLTLRCSRGGCG
jgi:hypothetical protein